MAKEKVKIDDVQKPNLYREIFPYHEFPKVKLDGKDVELDIPKEVWITDTTFRDGQQARPPYTPKQILRVFDLLHKIFRRSGSWKIVFEIFQIIISKKFSGR